ncbi:MULTISPECIES: DNA-directed RNA polymerase subunit alpha C-terminal domain-containing protein [Burkholderia cepacia complex]|uniref:DNA-directed RNA polymerase subunit alpha C-terminal domain-containing protein n=1 Tax=Burkholderia cepacia complex TaxID=87882 RepID=UPI000A8FD87E|nr:MULTISPECIES: DNA-directed RNA polymerase subunit alpha C-terminal domain-containing protein [Burkholderia cepacia complex]
MCELASRDAVAVDMPAGGSHLPPALQGDVSTAPRRPRQLLRMLRLAPRVEHALKRAGIRTIPSLCLRSERELLLISGLGRTSLGAITAALSARGLSLRDDVSDSRAVCAKGSR